jgi:hypothetical protein
MPFPPIMPADCIACSSMIGVWFSFPATIWVNTFAALEEQYSCSLPGGSVNLRRIWRRDAVSHLTDTTRKRPVLFWPISFSLSLSDHKHPDSSIPMLPPVAPNCSIDAVSPITSSDGCHFALHSISWSTRRRWKHFATRRTFLLQRWLRLLSPPSPVDIMQSSAWLSWMDSLFLYFMFPSPHERSCNKKAVIQLWPRSRFIERKNTTYRPHTASSSDGEFFFSLFFHDLQDLLILDHDMDMMEHHGL